MDLYITEYEEDNIVKVYDIEPNKYDIGELPRRSRYNQAITDVKLLSAGERYKNLPEYISIWILTEDPFGQNRMVYTVQNCVVEDSHIVYNDGVKKLFLYVGGKVGGSEEGIKERLDEAIEKVTKQVGIVSLIKSYKKFDASDEQIIESLMEEYKLSREEAESYLNE